MELRSYQQEAIDQTFAWLQNNEGNPLIVLPTGTGKSLVVADICRIATQYPDSRIICASHVAELVEQNYLEFIGLMPFAPAGIYSAGLNRREKEARILFCSIQSVFKKAYKLQRCDILLIDEAHTISRKGQSMWGKFIADLLVINPDMRVIGLTATPYRLDSGNLIGGEDAMFHAISYEYSILEAIQKGYLAEVVPKGVETKLDVSEVKKRGGEFIAGELQSAVNVDSITQAALTEVEAYGQNRRSWLIFACGVDHAENIHKELAARGYVGGVVTGETNKDERRQLIEGFKNYSLRYLVNNLVLTTGFNHKGVDLIADLNPTESAGLHVQKIGRGTRTADGKTNCLLLDFAGNVARHGPIDRIKGRDFKEKDGLGVPPMKECPKCGTIQFAGVRVCGGFHLDGKPCGHEFPKPEINIKSLSDNLPVLSTQKIYEQWDVTSVSYSVHRKEGKPLPTMRVTYMCGLRKISEWITFEHGGKARERACVWWNERCPIDYPAPRSVQEAVDLLSVDASFKKPSQVEVETSGKWPELIRCIFGQAPQPDEQLPSGSPFELLEDEIPF